MIEYYDEIVMQAMVIDNIINSLVFDGRRNVLTYDMLNEARNMVAYAEAVPAGYLNDDIVNDIEYMAKLIRDMLIGFYAVECCRTLNEYDLDALKRGNNTLQSHVKALQINMKGEDKLDYTLEDVY